LVHLLLLLGSRLHGLQIFFKGGGASSGSRRFEVDVLDTVGRDVGQVLNLLVQFKRKVVLLSAPERVVNLRLVLFSDASPGNPSRIADDPEALVGREMVHTSATGHYFQKTAIL
jgi:hypothetical protein